MNRNHLWTDSYHLLCWHESANKYPHRHQGNGGVFEYTVSAKIRKRAPQESTDTDFHRTLTVRWCMRVQVTKTQSRGSIKLLQMVHEAGPLWLGLCFPLQLHPSPLIHSTLPLNTHMHCTFAIPYYLWFLQRYVLFRAVLFACVALSLGCLFQVFSLLTLLHYCTLGFAY